MAQLTMNPEIIDTPSLREHIANTVSDIETVLPDGAPLALHIKRVSNRLFGAHFRARLLGHEVVVRAYDDNLFRALNRARRGFIRRIGEVRHWQRDESRSRRVR